METKDFGMGYAMGNNRNNGGFMDEGIWLFAILAILGNFGGWGSSRSGNPITEVNIHNANITLGTYGFCPPITADVIGDDAAFRPQDGKDPSEPCPVGPKHCPLMQLASTEEQKKTVCQLCHKWGTGSGVDHQQTH